jgi:dienelactone hydrolase
MSAAAPEAIGTRAHGEVWARLTAEAALARGALAVMGLHVLDDRFLQSEPGRAASDHLVSGLVPLVLISAAAISYPMLRPGLRASLALLFGYFGVLAGTEAVYYTAKGGPSGDDFTGFLSLAAGLLLLGLGCTVLWRSRRRDGSKAWRYGRRLLLAAGLVLAAGVVLLPTSVAYVVTHTARAEVPRAELGHAFEEVQFRTSDGLLLQGWYIPSRNRAAVIAFPGRSGPQKQARMLASHGYGVLLFDRRGEGASEGDPNAFGWGGERDLYAAVAYLRSRPDVDPSKIGAIGLSVGGEMLIHAAAHSESFAAVVSEGASGQSLRDELANPGLRDRLLDLPSQVSLIAALTIFTDELPPPSLNSEVAKIAPTAVFFVYGEHGQGGREKAPNDGFYAAAGEPKQIWEVPKGQHIAGITTQPEQYERRVIGFFDDALLPGP